MVCFFHREKLADVTKDPNSQQVHDEWPPADYWWTASLWVFLYPQIITYQVVAGTIHELWCNHGLLGYLRALVDAGFSNECTLLQRR